MTKKLMLKICSVLLALLMPAMPALTAEASDNLVQNPGFEGDLTNWHVGGSGGGIGIVDQVSGHSHSGSKSLFNGSSTAWEAWNQNIVSGLQAGTYTASCWVKSGGSFSQLTFDIYRNGSFLKGVAVPVNSSWTLFTVGDIRVSAGDSIRLNPYMNASANAWANWDDFSLTLNSSSEPEPDPGEMPVGDLPGWRQIFADDFTEDIGLGNFPAAVSSRWGAYPDGWQDTSHNGTYNATKTISISDGIMNIFLHTENGVHYVACPYPKLPGASSANGQLYGRYSVRFRADSLHGYKTAWLLWPDSETWPRDGEIDFPEGNLDGTIGAFMHRMNGTSGGDQDGYSSSATYGDWHIATTEWTPTSCKFILDGITIGNSTSRIPSTSMHYVLQTETTLDGYEPDDSTQGNVQVDWVVVYKQV